MAITMRLPDGHHHEAPDDDGIRAFVWAGPMAALPANLDVEGVRGGVNGTGGDDDGPGRIMPVQVAGEDHRHVLERAGLHHLLGAGAELFGGLEDEPYG
jgi:hypothetical protein